MGDYDVKYSSRYYSLARSLYPGFSGSFKFYGTGTSSSPGDTYGYVTKNGSSLTSNDDSQGSSQFLCTGTFSSSDSLSFYVAPYSTSAGVGMTIPWQVDLYQNVQTSDYKSGESTA